MAQYFKSFFTEQQSAFAGFVLSGILLTLMQAPHDLSLLAWIAWVPFMLACSPETPASRLIIAAYIVGLIYWLSNLYWLYLVTWPGYIVFSMVFGVYWSLLAFAVRFVRSKGWPLFAVAPLLFVGAEAWQGYLFTGFHWYFLAHSQYKNLQLIQICDIFGTLGVSVLIALVNGVVVDLVFALQGKKLRVYHFASVFIVLMMFVFAWNYGHQRLLESSKYLKEGPLIGSVQPNVPSNVKEEIGNGPKILNDLIAESQACIDAGATMVAWPETMVLAPMNREFMDHLQPDAASLQYHQQILEHSKNNAYILFGAHGADVGIRNGKYDIVNQYNAAYLYRPDGTVDPKRYNKIHLVPFGEYIPFRKTLPWVYNAFMHLTPYDYDYTLTVGTEHTLFTVNADGRGYNFGVLICYEDTDPTVSRKHVVGKDGQKRADWLVNLSNDGWYVRFNEKDRKVLPTVELAQRTAISVFRAVENRVSIIRSVNTGISCLIEPTGRIREGFKTGTLPKEAMARQGIAGWFVDTIPIDSRVTVFSRCGRLLDLILGIGLAIILALSVWDSRRRYVIKDRKS